MAVYVVYRAPGESKDRSVLPYRLKALGCKRLHSTFWGIDEERVYDVLKVLEKNQPIFLKRLREIKKPFFVKNKGLSQLGSLVIVMYTAPKESKRERIKNILKRAPCIRLCRSVYAFYQKHSHFDKDHQLVDAPKFVDFVREMRGDVKVFSRIVIVSADSIESLLKETRGRVEREVSGIIRSCKELSEKALTGEDVQLIKDSLSRNKRRLSTLRKVAAFYEKWLRMDFSRSIMKSYRAVKKVNSMLT